MATYVAGITLVSGVLFLLLAVLRMGWVARFLPQAVVTGFLFGAAIDVVIGELPKITGTDAGGSNSFQELRSWLGPSVRPTRRRWSSVCVALVGGVRAQASSRPAVPGALVLVVGGLLAARLLDLGERGVALVGDIPSGLPRLDVPDPALLWDHPRPASARPRSRWS